MLVTSAAKNAKRPASAISGQKFSALSSKSELRSLLLSVFPHVSRTIDLIVLHCSDTRPSQEFTIEKLSASHKGRGFGEYPGYHFYIRRDGTLYYCRPLTLIGCHVAGYNAHSIGVCYEGGHREDEVKNRKYEDNRTAEQMITLHYLLSTLHELLPRARICGHRDLPGVAKACPCFDAAKEYAYISKQ